MSEPLLSVENLTVFAGETKLVDSASFTLERGSRTGIIGESGSGKTITALAVMGLLPEGLTATGSIRLRGDDLLEASEKEMVIQRGNSMSMIFQEPMTALNPVMRIGKQIAEPLRIHQDMSSDEAKALAVQLLDSVGIKQPERRARSFPHELSGGQRQRAMIAMSLACGPDLVVADEPTTALDVTVQAQVLQVLRDRVVANETALVLITHDLPVVASVADEVIVLRDGVIVETGPTRQVFSDPTDAYTRRLVDAVPPMSRTEGVPPKHVEPPTGSSTIVEMRDVTKVYRLRRRHLAEAAPLIHAVDGVSLEVFQGETLGIVGESGSGKSTLARIMMGLEAPTSGEVLVDGTDLISKANLRRVRDIAQMVFQDPMGSLDPRMLVKDVVAEPLRSLGIEGDHAARVDELLEAVRLPADAGERYPHEFSGGQRQRIAIARALAPGPRLLIADEPVSALDMSVQTITLDLLDSLKRDFDFTMVFISHDLSVIHEISDRVIVLEHGKLVEQGPAGTVFANPEQQYTKDLLSAIPRLDGSFLA
ncbi:MAG: ABC transporter ATP-binding protein [Actinomycetota bacterium]|nr:ABC transporter ATP-binding protein [Actinomycetota bacterium]